MQIYVVQSGDTVNNIADRYDVPLDSIIYVNQLEYPYYLVIGQALLIQDDRDQLQRRTAKVNGYAYPFISPWVLRETLPFLTELSVFSYGFTTDGDLVMPLLDDTWMIEAAEEYNVLPILTLTPFGPDGNFNNYLISVIVNDMQAQQNLINQLEQMIKMKRFKGVDIDFEFILAKDRDAFTEFVKNVTNRVNALGYEVSVALAPKTSSEQGGILFEGKDFAGLGAAANHVLLMTYEWGYTYGPPMAVAPINMVRKVVDYAITQIPKEKINLGIPNYGYEWPLPFIQGVTKARTIGNVEAIQIAIANGANIQFDTLAQTPFFRYWRDGIEYEVWFEDVRSLKAKFELIKEYGFRGAGYWQIMRFFRANWILLQDMFYIV